MMRHRVKPGITGWAQVNGFRGQTDTLRKMSDRVEHDLYTSSIDLPHGPADHRPHGDLRMDGPQCHWDEPPARFPRGMPADRRSRIRGIPMAGQRWRAGSCAGGRRWWWCARAEGRRHWWWRFRAGRRLHAVSLVCTERRLRARRNRPAACSPADFRRAVEMLPLVSIDLLTARGATDGAAQQSAGPGRLVRARRAHPQERAAGAGAGPHRPRGTGHAAWTPCGVHEHFYSTNFAGEINRSTHYIVLAYEAERRGACRTRSIAATAGVARRHRRRP